MTDNEYMAAQSSQEGDAGSSPSTGPYPTSSQGQKCAAVHEEIEVLIEKVRVGNPIQGIGLKESKSSVNASRGRGLR